MTTDDKVREAIDKYGMDPKVAALGRRLVGALDDGDRVIILNREEMLLARVALTEYDANRIMKLMQDEQHASKR